MTGVTRPVLRWHGGKFRLAEWVMSHFPRHDAYVEPYGGAAGVLMQKPAIAAECYNDLDDAVVNVFRVLRDEDLAQRLFRLLELTPFARSEFNAAYEPTDDPVERARRTICLSFMGHGSDAVTRGYRSGFRSKFSNGRALPAQSWSTWPEVVGAMTRRLRGVLIEQTDGVKLMKRLDGSKTLFYVDPPYLPQTRVSKVGLHGYRHDLLPDDHRTLLRELKKLKGYVVLSAYHSSLYDRALKHWRQDEIEVQSDNINTGGGRRTEVLWMSPRTAAALDAEAMPLFGRVG